MFYGSDITLQWLKDIFCYLGFFCIQMFGFVLYVSNFTAKGNGSVLSIPKVRPFNSIQD